jgi:hypothetical protein
VKTRIRASSARHTKHPLRIMTMSNLKTLLLLSGLAHFLLVVGSVAIPRLLDWSKALASVPTLIRQMFWTYAGYILAINLCFGLVSVLGPEELINGSFLAKSVTLFIALYWLARVVIQFTYFDKTDLPKGLIYTWGEVALVLLFIAFTVVYSLAFMRNCSWI